MKTIARALRNLIIGLCLFGIVYSVFANWSFVFSKTVRGEVMEVERVIQPTAMLGANMTAEQMFSYAVLVRAENGEIFSSSSVDRQWAVIHKGYCVEARLYPYPPWDIDKADTYFNARLVKVLSDCTHALPTASPAASPTASAVPVTTPSPFAAPPAASPVGH